MNAAPEKKINQAISGTFFAKASGARPEERAVGLPPEFEIVAELRAVLLIQGCNDNFNLDVFL